MQKKVLGVFFLLLFLGVGFLMYKLLRQDVEVAMENTQYETPQKPAVKLDNQEKIWIKDMANKDAREFIFPVNELFMQIDSFGQKSANGGKLKSFRLVIDRVDRYSLFCVIQTLTSLKLPYMVIKEEKVPTIYIEEKSERALDKVVLELEKYEIKSKIVEVGL